MSNQSEGNLLLTQADEIELRLQKLAQSGFLYEFGRKAANLIDSADLSSVWNLLAPVADYSSRQEAYNLFRMIVDWSRRAQSYSRKKWGDTSTKYQAFKKSSQKVLLVFEKTKAPPNEIAVSFASLTSEFRELVEASPPPKWKKAITLLPDILRILIIVLRG